MNTSRADEATARKDGQLEYCPICGEIALSECRGEYHFDPPPNIPGGVIVVRDTEWESCSACGESILPSELLDAIEEEAERRNAFCAERVRGSSANRSEEKRSKHSNDIKRDS